MYDDSMSAAIQVEKQVATLNRRAIGDLHCQVE